MTCRCLLGSSVAQFAKRLNAPLRHTTAIELTKDFLSLSRSRQTGNEHGSDPAGSENAFD